MRSGILAGDSPPRCLKIPPVTLGSGLVGLTWEWVGDHNGFSVRHFSGSRVQVKDFDCRSQGESHASAYEQREKERLKVPKNDMITSGHQADQANQAKNKPWSRRKRSGG